MMKRSMVMVMVMGAAVLGACAGDADTAQTQASGASRFQRSPVAGPIATTIVPRAVDRTPISVVVTLAGPSVADLQAAAGRKLSAREKADVKALRIAEQAAPAAMIRSRGWHVIGSFQSAINGLKVRVPRSDVALLRTVPGVIDVKPVTIYTHENIIGVQRIQAPFAWAGVAGVHGEGIKVAIIDTGIDYTHADFGGPGTPAAFAAAQATSTQPADPALFGPAAPKVKGGIDLVGDDYDAGGTGDALMPVADSNPLDCAGHGTHVAGTVAGFGVLADGTTYHGTYDELTHPTHAFAVGPGVAPKADLYAVRVFGCSGSTDVVTEALEWAVDNDMDVVNMSLGAAFGTADSADALASDHAVSAGVVVVAAAGNDGDIRYIVSSPGATTKGIAVAATDARAFLRTTVLALPAVAADPARAITAIAANDRTLPAGTSATALVLRTGGAVSLGCDPAEFVAQGAAGKLVIVRRGVCARVAKAINGQKAGAAAVVMVNSTGDLPAFEGDITENPDTGEPYVVTIPFLGVRGPITTPGTDGARLQLRDGLAITLTDGTPIKTGTASFSSGGPRTGDSALKPDIAAPGVAIVSTAMGTGTAGVAFSGTSMATPHVAGTAALAIQAHPTWKPAAIKSAIMNSGNPDELVDYATRRVAAGLINAASVAGTQAYAYADRDMTTVNFGFEELAHDLFEHQKIRVRNDAAVATTFDVATTRPQGSPHDVTVSPHQILVPAHAERSIEVTIHVPAETAGNSDAFHDVAGLVTFTPTTATGNRGIKLTVPYYLVPRVSANVATKLPKLHGATPSGAATVSNDNSAIGATADFYAWGLESPDAHLGRIDLRAAGVQSFDSPDGPVIVFAINAYKGWSTPETQEFDVPVDVDGDGAPDLVVFSADLGRLTTGQFSGQQVAAIYDLASGTVGADFLAVAPTDASTIVLPVLASSLRIGPSYPRLQYTAQSFDLLSADTDAFSASAGFNALAAAITTGAFVSVAPNTTVSVPISVDLTEIAVTPVKGLMVVTQDNRNGRDEADLVKVKY